MGTPDIDCRHCGGTNCEHGDHCAECGCLQCGFPGARAKDSEGNIPGFCVDCDWEAAPGARQNWWDKQPKLTTQQKYRRVMEFLGADLPSDDEVGKPLYTNTDNDDRS